MLDRGPTIAVVDYGMGNLFSVKHAFEHVGVSAFITSAKEDVLAADAVVLPGVGAFGDAMQALHSLDLVGPLIEIAASDKLLVGICLGMQLHLTESEEFGVHKGLGIFPGAVVPFSPDLDATPSIKVPHVGWTRISKERAPDINGSAGRSGNDPWEGSPLRGVRDREFLYFVHSYYPVPKDPALVISHSRYGDTQFCSSLWRNNVFGCQFHPERSGSQGQLIYRNLASMIAPGGLESPGER